METVKSDVLIIGGGPGGYVCAVRAGQLGLDTTLVETRDLGGTCLNVGCIPSKALIHAANEYQLVAEATKSDSTSAKLGISASAANIDFGKTIAWKDGIIGTLNSGVGALLQRANVRVLKGHACFRDGKTVIVSGSGNETQVQCEHVVIATGSVPVELPDLPFTSQVLSSTDALMLQDIPETLAVVGGGYIGLELGTCFAKLGSKVTVIEGTNQILSQYDSALVEPVLHRLKALGVTVHHNTLALSYNENAKQLNVATSGQDQLQIDAEKVLVTVGRKAQLQGWGLSELSLTTSAGVITVDDQCRTSMRGVYAIGDVTGEPMLAHRAMAQGQFVAQLLAGKDVTWDKQCIPAVCFTDPEIVSVGLSTDEARAAGLDAKESVIPFRSNGRAMTLQRDDGFVRIVVDKSNHAVIGVQAVGACVCELATAFSLAVEMGSRAEDIAATVHAHPTLGEAFQEAAMMSIGLGLHS